MFSFNQLKKNLKKDFWGFKKARFAILSDSASQLLHQAIKAYGHEAQLDYEIYEADYNQIDLQIFDAGSELYEFNPDFIFINKSSERLLKEFYKKNSFEQGQLAVQTEALFRSYFEQLNSKLKAKVIINTFPEINDAVFGNFAAKVNSSFTYQLRKTNVQLMDLAQQYKNVFVCDIAALQNTLGYNFTFDPKMYVNGDMVYNIDFLPYIAKSITDIVQAVSGTFKKCVVLDLDNTLWGGIIGDDGMEGIQLGDLKLGKAYNDLQLWLKQLKNRGIILAVCSKNTHEIAQEPFDSHPDMVLRMADIAVFVANWETKVDNIRYIQSVLNIGMDSIVFLDDNPFERNMVREAIPELTIPELPEDPAEYLTYLRSLNLFETASFTEEDAERTRQYQEEAQRNILQKSFYNEADFLAGLEMEADVQAFNDFTIPRVAQLTQRSNQFNLRTIRYTESDIKDIIASPEYYTLSLGLKDKFGNHGLIGVIILKKMDENTLFVDTWIMSCRVLKRGMEQFTMNTIAELAKSNGYSKVIGEYLPTKKNGIVKDHYSNLGFASEGDKWVMDLNSFDPAKTFIVNK
jgi:FkbH-like protein